MGLIIGKVVADAINEKLGVSLKMGNLAVDATPMVSAITSEGDEVNFPKFDRIAEIDIVTNGTALVPKEVSMTENKATIKHMGGSIRVYDKDAKQIKGAVMDNMIQQIVDAMQKTLDTDLSVAMDAEATKLSPTASGTAITNAELLNGFALFGDDVDVDTFAGIAINSRLLLSFIAMPEFTSVEKTYQTNGNGIIKNNLVGYWMGIKIFLSNNNTYDVSKSECKTYMVKKNSLGYVKQQEVEVEEEREAKLFCTDIVAGSLYACKVLDPDGIVILRKTIA